MNSHQLYSEKIILVTGGSRSGKSEFAEILAAKSQKQIVYIATALADAKDKEWQERIAIHKQRRPKNWQSLNISDLELCSRIVRADPSECLLIDSLGTWIANLLDRPTDSWQEISDRFLASLQTSKAEIILVGEETGWGIVPAYPLGRLFRDRLGNLARHIGSIADTTYLVVGGHVLNLSLLGEPLSNYEL